MRISDIDKKDSRLLLALYEDGRMTTTQLAKRAGISQEVAVYRLKRLKERGLLRNITPIINVAALGLTSYRLQLKLRPTTAERQEAFEAYLRTLPQLSWLVRLAGPWDLAVLLNSKDNEEFWMIYNELFKQFGDLIDRKLFTIVTSITHLAPTYLLTTRREPLVQELHLQQYRLEENQTKVLRSLFEDGRKSILEIARECALSATTVKYHLNRLRERGIILGFLPLLNVSVLGYEHFKVTLRLDNPAKKGVVREILLQEPNVVYITESLGYYDLEFECEYHKAADVLKLLEQLKSKIHIREEEIIFRNEEIVVNEVPS